ncbi:hypothetical protein [Oceanicoccus sagamiensis]|uniref:Uncharacterized protein n=1 Tax=Oceanicoccus sagamiensis TaxID=716816 RepID=A0A1X9NC84_9GAMM|nr:hypothetical protein [Oceanicoccus sagamiensis]ARN74042.1 hypothetical protein BST96_07870 [Oceanicoccus sagamiensis]
MTADSESQVIKAELQVVHQEANPDWVEGLNGKLKIFEGDLRNHIGISSFYDEAMRNLVSNVEPRNAVEVKQGMVLVGDWLIDKSDDLIHSFDNVNNWLQMQEPR